MKIIKAGFLVSYDYEFLKVSLPLVYPFVDEVFLAVDHSRKTWSGKDIVIEQSFWTWIDQMDVNRKITIYEDDFYVETLNAIDCDTRERMMLAEQMGAADWYIQIDSDEYFFDFKKIRDKLESFEVSEPVTINCRVIPMFKKIQDGYLLVNGASEYLPFITNKPSYTYARSSSTTKQLHWEELVLHQSWARASDEIQVKLNNWGHKDDFNIQSYFNIWQATDEFNCIYLKDFHPLDKYTWPALKYYPANSIVELINKMSEEHLIEVAQDAKEKRKFKFLKGWF